MIMQGENLYQCNALFNDAESTTINDLKHSNDSLISVGGHGKSLFTETTTAETKRNLF